MHPRTTGDDAQRDQGTGGCLIIAVGLLAASVLVGFVLWLLDVPRRLTGEVRTIPSQAITLHHEMGTFQRVVDEYSAKNQVPPRLLADLVKSTTEPGMRLLRRGQDPWNNTFVYNVQILRQSDGTIDFSVTLRSVGPNGIDENGKGDDIQRIVEGTAVHNRYP